MKNYTRLFLAITMFLGVAAFLIPSVVSAQGSPSGLFTFISPLAGEKIVAGKTYNIQWKGPIEWIMSPGVTESIKNVKLTVSCGNPSLGATNDIVIVKSTKNDGLYKWSVPKKIGSSDYCRITIEDTKGKYYDVGPVFGIGIAPLQYTLTYTAGANGSLAGNLSQTVYSGLNGTAVTAVPASSYQFVNWSDGMTTASRTDTNVVANINVTANFSKIINPSTLTITADISTPTSTSINVDSTSGTTDVPMLVFSAKSTVGASAITDVKITAVGDNSAIGKINAIKLYDGSTLLGSQSLSGPTATFSYLSIPVAQDATKTLTVKADFAAGVTNGSNVYLEIADPTTDITYQQPDSTSANATGSAIVGNAMYLYDGVAAHFSFVNATATYTYNSTTPSLSSTTGVITLRVHSDGGTTTKPIATDFTVNAYNNGILIGAVTSKIITVTPDSNIPDGSDATVVINVSEPRSTSGTGFVNFATTGINWVVGSSGTINQTWGLDNYKTPSVNAF